MIIKPIPSNNIPSGIRYGNDKDKGAEIILSNGVRIDSNKNCINDFLMISKQRDISKPFLHTVFSFSPQDASKVTEGIMAEIVSQYLQKMGLDQNQYIVYVHRDKQPHCHCFSNRVGFNGDLVSDSFTKVKAFKFAREMELKYGLTVAIGRNNSRERSDENKEKRRAKNEIRNAIFEGLDSGISNFDMLSKYLDGRGIEMRIEYQSTGRINGLSFRKEYAFKGSSIDRNLSYQKLEKRFSKAMSITIRRNLNTINSISRDATNLANDFAKVNEEHLHDTDIIPISKNQ